MKNRKMLSFFMAVVFVASILCTNVLAATTNIGSTTHTATTGEPVYFKLQGDITYSVLYGNEMTINSMQSRVWNYSNSGDMMSVPTFSVQDGTYNHSTEDARIYNLITIPVGTNNYYTNCDWEAFVDDEYGDSNTYEIPSSSSDTSRAMYAMIGVFGGDYQMNIAPIHYNYASYWHGDGYIRILDQVANEPYWRTKNVSSLQSVVDEPVPAFSISSVNDSANLIDAENDSLSFALNTEYDGPVYYTSLPEVAMDANFEDCIEIDEDDISIDANDTMFVNTEFSGESNTLFVKTPDITVVNFESNTIVRNVTDIEAKEISDEDSEVRLLELSYDRETFPITPNSATLLGNENIKAISSMVFYDDDNNVIGGSFIFSVPNDYACPETYDLMLHGELVDIEGTVYEVNVA